MTTKNEGLELDVKAKNAYLYSQNDMTQLMLLTSQAADSSVAICRTPGSTIHEGYTNTFNSYIGDKLHLSDSGMVDNMSSLCAEISVENTPTLVSVTAGAYTWSAPKEKDTLGIRLIAAPYKATFKPVATRYELDKAGLDSLSNTFSRLFRDNVVYRVAGTDTASPQYDYMSIEKLLEIAGVSPLRNGNAVSKHKGIKVFKLGNGLGLKLGDTVMIAVTEASPRYAVKDSLYVKQEDPETSKWYLEPVTVCTAKGFNPNLKQFAYDVSLKNGSQIFDVPESDLMVDKLGQEKEKSIENVSWDHFN